MFPLILLGGVAAVWYLSTMETKKAAPTAPPFPTFPTTDCAAVLSALPEQAKSLIAMAINSGNVAIIENAAKSLDVINPPAAACIRAMGASVVSAGPPTLGIPTGLPGGLPTGLPGGLPTTPDCTALLAMLPAETKQAINFALSSGNALIIENMAAALERVNMPQQAACVRSMK